MSSTIHAGFVPLVDSAVLVAAREQGFARDAGFSLELVRQASWASLRDHLNLGHVDCAHALAPLPIAGALGVGQVQSSSFVPFVLGRGGNAITVSSRLAEEMRDGSEREPATLADWGQALKARLKQRLRPVTLAMVYPFSGHNFELRYWLAAAGIHPDRDLRLVAIPPPYMVDSLRAGQVDGFCVGEPWNSLAVDAGLGEIIVSKSQIFPRGIEKVLAVAAGSLVQGDRLTALLLALDESARWCDQPKNRGNLVELLARPEYLGVDPGLSLQSLEGRLPLAQLKADPDFLYFSRHDATRPRTEEALWIYAQMQRWGQIPGDTQAERRAAGVFRPDLYARVLGEGSTTTAELLACDAVPFDGLSVTRYLQNFPIATPFESSAAGLNH